MNTEKIIDIIKSIFTNIVAIVSLIAGEVFFISTAFVDSASNIPLIICGACIGWFALVYIGAWIAKHFEIIVEK